MSVPVIEVKPNPVTGGHDDARERGRRVEELRQGVSNLEARLAEMKERSARTSPLLRAFGRQFGFGAAGKIDWANFKLTYLRDELARLESV